MKNAKEFAREHSYKIPMLDASVIYRLNASGSGLKLYERVKNSKGNEKYKPNTALFSGALKYCLETKKLESVYKETFRVKSFCSVHNDNRYSDVLISVSFDSTYKEYNVFRVNNGILFCVSVRIRVFGVHGIRTARRQVCLYRLACTPCLLLKICTVYT